MSCGFDLGLSGWAPPRTTARLSLTGRRRHHRCAPGQPRPGRCLSPGTRLTWPRPLRQGHPPRAWTAGRRTARRRAAARGGMGRAGPGPSPPDIGYMTSSGGTEQAAARPAPPHRSPAAPRPAGGQRVLRGPGAAAAPARRRGAAAPGRVAAAHPSRWPARADDLQDRPASRPGKQARAGSEQAADVGKQWPKPIIRAFRGRPAIDRASINCYRAEIAAVTS